MDGGEVAIDFFMIFGFLFCFIFLIIFIKVREDFVSCNKKFAVPIKIYGQMSHSAILENYKYTLARTTGLEPATSCVTGRHSNQLNYVRALGCGVYTQFEHEAQEVYKAFCQKNIMLRQRKQNQGIQQPPYGSLFPYKCSNRLPDQNHWPKLSPIPYRQASGHRAE